MRILTLLIAGLAAVSNDFTFKPIDITHHAKSHLLGCKDFAVFQSPVQQVLPMPPVRRIMMKRKCPGQEDMVR